MTIPDLCMEIEKQTYPESIRHEIVRIMGNRESVVAEDLAEVERTCESLYKRGGATDSELAVMLGDLAIAFSKRLRHRMTVDAPLRLEASSVGRKTH